MAQKHGEIQIRLMDAAKMKSIIVAEFHTRDCGSTTDKEQKPFIPLKTPWVKPDSFIGLYYKGEAGAETVLSASTLFQLDCTYRRRGAKEEFGFMITENDLTYGRDIATNNVITPKAGEWGELGLYKVPAGIEVAVGRRHDGYAYVYIDV